MLLALVLLTIVIIFVSHLFKIIVSLKEMICFKTV